jgi:hypothetical protein
LTTSQYTRRRNARANDWMGPGFWIFWRYNPAQTEIPGCCDWRLLFKWREKKIEDPWCRFPDGLGYTLDLTGRCKDF